MTVKTFIDKVKETEKPWTLKNYDTEEQSWQDFVASTIKVINHDYSPEQDKDDNLKDEDISIIIRNEFERHISNNNK